MTARIVPHQTRVVVPGGAAGMVIGVRNAGRRLVGTGMRVDVPSRVVVKLDSGRRGEFMRADVAVEVPTA